MADALFTLRVLSPLGTVFEGKARSATLPTAEGEIMILARHMPLVCVLVDGEMRVDTGQKIVSIAIAGGFLDTSAGGAGAAAEADEGLPQAVVLSDFAAESDSIEVARAEAAKRRAEELLAEKKDRGEVLLVERDLQRAILQLKIAEKVKRRRPT
jgi:F-type H+-transporting ATPase subunit epsilon